MNVTDKSCVEYIVKKAFVDTTVVKVETKTIAVGQTF